MGALMSMSRQNAGVVEVDIPGSGAYRYPPKSGCYFGSYFIMGGERFDTAQPEAYLFGENTDLNFLGNRPVPFPYPTPQTNEPTKTLKSLVNIRKDSLRFVRAAVVSSEEDVDGGATVEPAVILTVELDDATSLSGPDSQPGLVAGTDTDVQLHTESSCESGTASAAHAASSTQYTVKVNDTGSAVVIVDKDDVGEEDGGGGGSNSTTAPHTNHTQPPTTSAPHQAATTERKKPSTYNIEFIFDCDVRVAITIHYFCTEEIDNGNIKYTSRQKHLSSPTYYYEPGANQLFSQVEHIFDPSGFTEEELTYSFDREVIPIIVQCVTADKEVHGDRQYHMTYGIVDKLSDGTYQLKPLKQKQMIDGLCYLLQEIYGIENKNMEHQTAFRCRSMRLNIL